MILARLSTGVMVVDPLLRLRIVNEAAGSILGVNLAADLGRSLAELADHGNERFGRFVQELSVRLGAQQTEWREQISLPPDRVLRCACSRFVMSSNTMT